MWVSGRTWIGLVAVVCLAAWAATHAEWFRLAAAFALNYDGRFYLVFAALSGGVVAGTVIIGMLTERIGLFGTFVSGALTMAIASSLPFIIPVQPAGPTLAALGMGLGFAAMSKPMLLVLCVPSIPGARLATASCVGWTAAMGLAWLINHTHLNAAGLGFDPDHIRTLLVACAVGVAIAAVAGWGLKPLRPAPPPAAKVRPTPWRAALLLVVVWFAFIPDSAMRDIASKIVAEPTATAMLWAVALIVAAGAGIAVDRYGSRRGLRLIVGTAFFVPVASMLLPPDPSPVIVLTLQLSWEIARVAGMPVAFVYLIHQFPQLDIRRFALVVAGTTIVSGLVEVGAPLLRSQMLMTWLPIVAAFVGWFLLTPRLDPPLAESGSAARL